MSIGVLLVTCGRIIWPVVFLGGVSGGAVGGVVEKLAVHVGRTVCPLHPTS